MACHLNVTTCFHGAHFTRNLLAANGTDDLKSPTRDTVQVDQRIECIGRGMLMAKPVSP